MKTLDLTGGEIKISIEEIKSLEEEYKKFLSTDVLRGKQIRKKIISELKRRDLEIYIDGEIFFSAKTPISDSNLTDRFLNELFTKQEEKQRNSSYIDIIYLARYGMTRKQFYDLRKIKMILSFINTTEKYAQDLTKSISEVNDIYEISMLDFKTANWEDVFENMNKKKCLFLIIVTDLNLLNEPLYLTDLLLNRLFKYHKNKIFFFLTDDVIKSGDLNIMSLDGIYKLIDSWEKKSLESPNPYLKDKYSKIMNCKQIIYGILSKMHMKSYSDALNEMKENHEFPYLYFNEESESDLEAKKFVDRLKKSITIFSQPIGYDREFPPRPFENPNEIIDHKIEITYKNYNILVWDESKNLAGTHKDRRSWEEIKKIISILDNENIKAESDMPKFCLLSNGSHAISTQFYLNLFKLNTQLNVLTDLRTNDNIIREMENIGCNVKKTDLSQKIFNTYDILKELNLTHGFDLTYQTLWSIMDKPLFYNWLSYDLINLACPIIFIPFGSGELFLDILKTINNEYLNSIALRQPDFRLNKSPIPILTLYGAACFNSKTKYLHKLFGHKQPLLTEISNKLQELKGLKCISEESQFIPVHDFFVEKAMELADNHNLIYEPSGLAGLALFLQIEEKIDSKNKILIVNTGKTRNVEDLKKYITEKHILLNLND